VGPRLSSATARRNGISNQLLFAWRKAYREGRFGAVGGFVAAVLRPEPPAGPDRGMSDRIEIVSSNGLRIIVDADVDAAKLLRLLRGLEALP